MNRFVYVFDCPRCKQSSLCSQGTDEPRPLYCPDCCRDTHASNHHAAQPALAYERSILPRPDR